MKAERVETVAISANTGSAALQSRYTKQAALFIQDMMTEAVSKAYKEGKTSADELRTVIQEARELAKRELDALQGNPAR